MIPARLDTNHNTRACAAAAPKHCDRIQPLREDSRHRAETEAGADATRASVDRRGDGRVPDRRARDARAVRDGDRAGFQLAATSGLRRSDWRADTCGTRSAGGRGARHAPAATLSVRARLCSTIHGGGRVSGQTDLEYRCRGSVDPDRLADRWQPRGAATLCDGTPSAVPFDRDTRNRPGGPHCGCLRSIQ